MNKEKLKHHAHPLLFLTGKSRTKLGRENAKIHKNVHRPPDITLWNSISIIRSASGHPSSNPDQNNSVAAETMKVSAVFILQKI